MNTTNALLLATGFGAPLIASKVTAGSYTGAEDWRNVAALTAIGSGLVWLLSRNPTAGAIALGAGAGAAVMEIGKVQEKARLAAQPPPPAFAMPRP
jgi:hypothetical protein